MLRLNLPFSCFYVNDTKKNRVVAQKRMIRLINAAMFRKVVKALIFDANLAWVDKWLVTLSGLPLKLCS